MRKLALVLFALFVLGSCSGQRADALLPAETDEDAFNGYWQTGKAELTRYALEQPRYGEIHPGDAVLIFVTEPFLSHEQVKQEHGEDKSYQVLKLNANRKFLTGIYDYSMMTSTFTRIDFDDPFTAKVSFSAQEWCGHVYMQLNHLPNGIRGELHSYFQDEADQTFQMKDAEMEDGIWTTIRTAPRHLPKGKVEMIPGLAYLRLSHTPTKTYEAETGLEQIEDKTFAPSPLLRYRVHYKELERTLDIFFEKTFPHRIMGWREQAYSGFGESKKMMTTVARRTHELKTDYWTKNRLGDEKLREQLGLKP